MTRTDPLADLFHILARDGFAYVTAARMRPLFEVVGSLKDWADFTASWGDLGLDTYMADGGRYRKRRFGVFAAAAAGPIVRAPHQPHYQSRDYNALNGGIERWFPPIAEAAAAGPSMRAILATCRSLFDRLTPGRVWHIEVHQFRIEAKSGVAGQPTPEGMHHDGVDYVLVLLIRRENIRSGVTSIHDLTGHTLGSFTLAEPFAAALVDDHRVMHGVTPVEPEDPARPAFRDVLVVTFREAGGDAAR
ncbi:MAG: 2OG-Fe dioxygenase family protein [Acetobacteraceae bacterium]